jgi:hypothetical protein
MISQYIIDSFNSMKTNHDASALLLTLDSNNRDVLLLSKVDVDTAYQDIVAQLPKDDLVFLIVIFNYETDEKPPLNTVKILLITWIPERTPARRKMSGTMIKGEIQQAFDGLQKDLTVSNFGELDYDVIRKLLI